MNDKWFNLGGRFTILFLAASNISSCRQQNGQEDAGTKSQSSAAPQNAAGVKGNRDAGLKGIRNAAQSIPMLQVASSSTTVQIHALVPSAPGFRFSVLENGVVLKSLKPLSVISRPYSNMALVKLKIDQLKANQEYEIVVNDPQGLEKDRRRFATSKTDSKVLRFAYSSCMVDEQAYLEPQAKLYAKLAQAKPDLVLLGGDQVYVDSFEVFPKEGPQPTKQDIWKRYVTTWQRLHFYRLERLIPTLSTWDDHDFGTNDGDSTYQLKQESYEVYQAFYGAEPIPGVYERGHGVGSMYLGFGQRFLMLDNRTFRLPAKSTNLYAHWGAAQEAWLFQKLKSAKTPAWILSGNEFFGSHHTKESFERNHPENFKNFLSELAKLPVAIALASGDMHVTEVTTFEKGAGTGKSAYEFTFGPWHSRISNPLNKMPNPRRIAGADVYNFGLFTSRSLGTELSVDVDDIGIEQEAPLFQLKNLKIQR